MTENEISAIVVDVSLLIHRKLGPGLLESVYLAVLAHELKNRGLDVQTEVKVPVEWDGIKIDIGFRADLILDGLVLLELKSVESIAPVHKKQTLTYLRLTDIRLGLLLNFGAALMKGGIYRIVNNLEERQPEPQMMLSPR